MKQFWKRLDSGSFLYVHDVLVMGQKHDRAAVPHELGNCSDVHPIGYQLSGEGVPQIIRTDAPRYVSPP